MTLDPLTNPLVTDRDGDGKPGLGDVGVGTSDWFRTDGRYNIFWNIAVGAVNSNTRTVSVIVLWKDRGTDRKIIMQGVLPF